MAARREFFRFVLLILLGAGGFAGRSPAAPVCVSRTPGGLAGNGDSGTLRTAWETFHAVAPVAAGNVYFVSLASNLGTTPPAGGTLAQAFSRDLGSGNVRLLTRPGDAAEAGAETGDGHSTAIAVSEDGAAWCVLSEAMNLMAPTFDTNPGADIFLWRALGQETELTCPSGPAGMPFADGAVTDPPCLSRDGTKVVFASQAANLVSGDGNGAADVFLYDAVAGTAELLSKAADGTPGNGESREPAISDDARYVAFTSQASNLVPGDSNGVADVFLLDRASGAVTRVSHRLDGTALALPAHSPAISGDGRFVAYVSADPGIVAGDTNGVADVFVWDRASGATERVSVSSGGEQADAACGAPRLSEHGRFVVFVSTATTLDPACTGTVQQIFLYDRDIRRIRGLSMTDSGIPADADCFAPWISADARYVTFSSRATVFSDAGDGTYYQVFLVDRGPHAANHPPAVHAQTAVVSPGHTVAIELEATDPDGDSPLTFEVVALPAHGTLTLADGATPVSGNTLVSQADLPLLYSAAAGWTGDDQFVFAAVDPWGAVSDSADCVVRVSDFQVPFLSVESVSPEGALGDNDTPSFPFPARLGIAANGTLVFGSRAANLVPGDANDHKDVFCRDYWGRKTAVLSSSAAGLGNADSYAPAAAPDGSAFVFVSAASNLDGTDGLLSTDLFLCRGPGKPLERIALDDPENADAPWAVLSEHGSVLAFSTESALLPGDTNGTADVYRWPDGAAQPVRISVGPKGEEADGASFRPAMDWTGQVTAFVSTASNLAPDDSNGAADIFVFCAGHDALELASVSAQGEAADADSADPGLSMSGRFLVFSSRADNLVSTPATGGHWQIYVKDRVTGLVEMASVNAGGAPADSDCSVPTISADGRYVAFLSAAGNLAAPALPGGTPVQAWVKDRVTGKVVLASQAEDGHPADAPVTACALSPDGRLLAFASAAANLSAADGRRSQLFVADLGPRSNLLPLAHARSVSTLEDTPAATIPLESTDDNGDDLLVEIVDPPRRGQLGSIVPPGPGREFAAVSYTPAPNVYGTDRFTFRCRDAHGWSDPAAITVQITEVNDPPRLEPIQNQEIAEHQTLEIPLPFSDADSANQPPTDTWTMTVVSGPGTVIDSGSGFIYRYTPDYSTVTPAEHQASMQVAVRLSDGRGGSDTRTFSVTVDDVNAPPAAAAAHILPAAPVFTGSPLTPAYEYSDLDGDPEQGSTIRWYVRTPGRRGSAFVAYTGPFVTAGDPASGVPASATAKHQQWYFTVTPKDARGLAGLPVESPHIEIADSAPELSALAGLTTLEDTPVDLTVAASDADTGENLTLVITQPAHGTVAESARGVRSGAKQTFRLKYSPAPNFFTAPGETDVFFLQVSDGEVDSPVHQVAVTVTPVNDPPVLKVLAPVTVPQDGAAAPLALAPAPGACLEVTDVDNDVATEVSVKLLAAPVKGSLFDAGGVALKGGAEIPCNRFPLTYQPHTGAAGTDSLQLQASDGQDASERGDVILLLPRIQTDLHLLAGWNLISFPMQPVPADPAELLVEPGGNGPVYTGFVWEWDAAARHYRTAAALQPYRGYWVYCSEPRDVEVSGTRVDEAAVSVPAGWNLIGPVGYGDSGRLISGETGGAPPAGGTLWFWDAGQQRFRVGSATELKRNCGYWFLARTPQAITLDLPLN